VRLISFETNEIKYKKIEIKPKIVENINKYLKCKNLDIIYYNRHLVGL